MTTEAYTPAAPALVQGVGPYAIPHAYTPGSIRAAVQVGDQLVELSAADFSVTPEASDSAGQLMLTPEAAALHDGRLLLRRRATAVQQGWQGVLGNREKGLERQLDILAQGLQEYVDVAARSLRAPIPMPEFVPAAGRALIFDDALRPVMGPTAADIAAAAPSAATAVAAADAALQAAGLIGRRPEDFGAVGGFRVDPATRTVFDAASAIAPVRAPYLWLLERTIRRFQRARIWASVTATAGTGGYVDFTASGLTAREQVAFDWIDWRYEQARDGANASGTIVTAGQLDAADAIDLTANTAAMRAWLAAVQAPGAIGRLGPYTYPVNDTLRLNGVRIEGFKGLSRIQMGPAVDYNVQLVVCGITDEPAADVNVYGVIFDGNYERRKGGSAGSGIGNSNLWGTTLCLSYLRDSKFDACEAWDARKHACDVTGATHGRSGTPYTYPAQAQISQNIEMIDFVAEGAGDDLLTTHNCNGIQIVRPFVAFSTGDFFTSGGDNSNGIELDDASVQVSVRDGYAAFCYTGLEIKGHFDAIAAHDCSVRGMQIEHANNGVICRHIDHGDTLEPQSPSARSLRISDVTVRSPLAWRTGDVKVAARIYAYDTTKIGDIIVEQGIAPDDYYGSDPTNSNGIVQVLLGAKDTSFGKIQINGFPDVIAALRVTSNTRGYVNVDQLNTFNGPLRGLHHTGGAVVNIGSGSLHRNTATAGSIGIRGTLDMTRIGPLTTINFEQRHSFSTTVTSMRREDGLLLDETFDLDTYGATTSGENYAFDRVFAWGDPAPANAPCLFAVLHHLSRTNGSRAQWVFETAAGQRIFYRSYTLGAWTAWRRMDLAYTGWGIRGSTTFTGDLNDLMTVNDRGVFVTGSGTTTNMPSGFSTVNLIQNMPRESGTRGAQLIFNSPAEGSSRVAVRGYGTSGFTAWAEIFTEARAIPPGPYADDTAAGAAGVPIGSIYRQTGGAVLWRQT